MNDWKAYGDEYVHGLEARIDVLEAQLAAVRAELTARSDIITDLVGNNVELEAQLAAVPKWVRITDDPETWPPKTDDYVLYWLGEPSADVAWRLRASCEADVKHDDWQDQLDYWLPITPPQVEP